MGFPQMPNWEAMHPLIVHFPIVLLLLSPLFVFIAAVLPPAKNRPYMGVGLITLIFGTISLFLAAVTGEQAAMVAGAITSLNPIIEAHATWAAPTPSGL